MRRPYLLHKRGKVWYYRLAGQRTFHSTGQAVESKAHAYALAVIQQKESRQQLSQATLKEYARDFFDWERCPWIQRQHSKGHSFSRTVAADRRAHLKNHIFPRFGSTLLAELNAVEVETWLSSLDLSNQTRMHILNSLRIVLREAKREGLLAANPLAEVETFSVRHQRRGVLTEEELEALFPRERRKFKKVWPLPYHGVMYALMVSSGARSGEIRALPWRAVIWKHSGILILRAVTADGIMDLPKGSSRSREFSRQRAVVVPKRTLDLLAWWRRQTRYPSEDQLVFPGAGGRPLARRTVSISLQRGLQGAKIEPAGRILVTHSLRHTYNTRMKELLTGELFEEFTGQSLLREFTGHHSQKMTDWYDNPEWATRLAAYGKARAQIEHFWKEPANGG
jgi:integrase